MSTNTLIYNVEDKPKLSKLLVFALQQVLAVLAATIAVPTIIGLPIAIPSAILGAGLGTIVYLLFTKFKSPVVISSSFAFLGALANAVAFGYMGITLGAIFAGLVYVAIAIIIKFTGAGWLFKLLPPVVIGPTVALIGLSLAGSAMGDIVKANGASIHGSYNLVSLFCGIATFLTVVICSVQNRKKGLRLLPFITGIGVGYALASIFSIIGYCANVDYLKVLNWDPLINNFKNITVESFLSVPKLSLVEGIKELSTGKLSIETYQAFASNHGWVIPAEVTSAGYDAVKAYIEAACEISGIAAPEVINGAGIASVALAFIPVAFVTFTEHVADHSNLGSIINRHLLREEPGLSRTLLGDGVGSIVGTCFGVCPNTTYGESVGCVAITKNASVRTILTAAIMLIVLAFLTPITALLRTIPSCVMGGVCLTLYGFIACSGLKMFKHIDLNENKNLFTVAVILISGIGGLAIQIPYAFASNGAVTKTIQITSIATALILGVITKLICEAIEKRNLPEEKEDAPEDRFAPEHHYKKDEDIVG